MVLFCLLATFFYSYKQILALYCIHNINQIDKYILQCAIDWLLGRMPTYWQDRRRHCPELKLKLTYLTSFDLIWGALLATSVRQSS